jgi:hypothetical protein
MPRYSTGTPVRLREPLRRNRWHKHGPVRVRRGARGRVLTSSRHWRKGTRYNVAFRRWRRPEREVRSVPAAKLSRLLSGRHWMLLLAVVLALAVLATGLR